MLYLCMCEMNILPILYLHVWNYYSAHFVCMCEMIILLILFVPLHERKYYSAHFLCAFACVKWFFCPFCLCLCMCEMIFLPILFVPLHEWNYYSAHFICRLHRKQTMFSISLHTIPRSPKPSNSHFTLKCRCHYYLGLMITEVGIRTFYFFLSH